MEKSVEILEFFGYFKNLSDFYKLLILEIDTWLVG